MSELKKIGQYRIYVVKKLFRAFKEGYTITKACDYAGIGTATYFRWYNKKPKFRTHIDNLMSGRNDLVRDALFNSALNGDTPAGKAWLTHNASWRFNENTINVSASASAEVHQEVENDPERAKSRLQDNLSVLERYGHLAFKPSEN